MDVIGTNGNDTLRGTDGNDQIFGLTGSDIVIGSKGNDTIFGFFPPMPKGPAPSPEDRDTLDYSNIGRPVKLIFSDFNKLSVDKSDFGLDIIQDFSQIIAPINNQNQIDGRSAVSGQGLNVNLGDNYAGGTVSFFGRRIEIKNFVNAIGTNNNDTIVGANKKGKLTGGGGNDTITGGNKNDILTGSDSTARGVGEVDTLTGGGGRDKFVLGDQNGAYYVGKGKDDYALITDFNLFQDSISIGNLKNYSFASGGNNTIELYSGKDVNTRDLIAKIQLTGGISPRSSNSRSVMGADASLNAITSKLDIVSGSSADA
jgi:Ca2+-binding RTX toxin-like protein